MKNGTPCTRGLLFHKSEIQIISNSYKLISLFILSLILLRRIKTSPRGKKFMLSIYVLDYSNTLPGKHLYGKNVKLHTKFGAKKNFFSRFFE